MKIPRRQFLHLAGSGAALPTLSHFATAQTYPTRPVRIIVGQTAGGGQDIFARLMGQWLSVRLGRQFIIDNRPGASGDIGAVAALRAPADGYTLLLVGPSNAINATLHDIANFNFIRDISPVASIAYAPLVMEVPPSFPARTAPEFIVYAKANPGTLNMASPGIGTSVHLAGELFKMMTGVSLVHVPYLGAPAAVTGLMSGQVQVTFDNLPNSIEYIKAGRLRPLAVTTATRSQALPDVPTVGEFVPGYEVTSWWGIVAPRNTPLQIVELLNKEINAALASPVMAARFTDLGAAVFPGSVGDFRKFLGNETEKWGKVIRAAGIKP
jgi:tripartite-type tricarboxylate transporter receptor subunit TctC